MACDDYFTFDWDAEEAASQEQSPCSLGSQSDDSDDGSDDDSDEVAAKLRTLFQHYCGGCSLNACFMSNPKFIRFVRDSGALEAQRSHVVADFIFVSVLRDVDS